jgi:hypothetical protein
MEREAVLQKAMLLLSLIVAAAVFLASRLPVQSAPADATFAVNDQSDAVDNNIGDGVCLAANGKCTLRAAIEEANARFADNPATTYTITVPGGNLLTGPRVYALTLTGNDANNAGDGGGLFVASGPTLLLRNSLLSGNVDLTASGAVLPDCAGDVISLDYNLIQQTPAAAGCNVTGTTGHNKIGTFPNALDTLLQNNGGTTPTLALPPGSAAINASDPTGCQDENGQPLTTDQRGFPRLGACDSGAYEFVLRGFLPLILR